MYHILARFVILPPPLSKAFGPFTSCLVQGQKRFHIR